MGIARIKRVPLSCGGARKKETEMLHIKWKIPTPLREDKAALPDFPLNCLSPVFKEMAYGIARTTSTDVSMASTVLLSAVSYCFSGMYRMEGKKDHTEPLTLYSLILAEPSEKKSPVMRFSKAPFVSFESNYNEDNKTEIFASQERRDFLKNEIEAMKKSGKATPDEIAAKRTEYDNMSPLNFRRLTVDDITPEALVKLLQENNTLLMISDEAGVFGNFGGRYNNGIANLDLLLKACNGESYQSDRCTHEPLKLPSPYLSICLCGQPYILDNLMQNPAFLMSGMVARFIYCFPKSKVGSRRYNTEPIPEKTKTAYSDLTKLLLKNKFDFYDGNEKLLRFTDEASEQFSHYYDTAIEPVMLTDFAEYADWGGKYHGLILRICGILHCIKYLASGIAPESQLVELLTLAQAIDIAAFYKEQAKYAYGMSAVDSNAAKAEFILGKIKSRQIRQISKRELYRLCRSKYFKNTEEFSQALDMLIDYDYVVSQTVDGANGNPKNSTVIVINPLLYGGQSGQTGQSDRPESPVCP